MHAPPSPTLLWNPPAWSLTKAGSLTLSPTIKRFCLIAPSNFFPYQARTLVDKLASVRGNPALKSGRRASIDACSLWRCKKWFLYPIARRCRRAAQRAWTATIAAATFWWPPKTCKRIGRRGKESLIGQRGRQIVSDRRCYSVREKKLFQQRKRKEDSKKMGRIDIFIGDTAGD